MGEYINSKFEKAYKIEMYIANTEGYEGDGDFFSKFGLEIRDTSNFVVSKRTFDRYVPTTIALHPREGDLIYVPVFGKMFEIKFVEEELLFHSIGKRTPYIYELRCETFRYSNEDMTTGIEEVDLVEIDNSFLVQLSMSTGSGLYIIDERVYQGPNLAYANASADVKSWNPATKKLLIFNQEGNFTSNANAIGATSNAIWNVVSVENQGDYSEYDNSDNLALQTEANTLILTTETNPFGSM